MESTDGVVATAPAFTQLHKFRGWAIVVASLASIILLFLIEITSHAEIPTWAF